MKNKIYKGVRLPLPLASRIDRVLKMDGETFATFIRVAALRELKKREKEIAA